MAKWFRHKINRGGFTHRPGGGTRPLRPCPYTVARRGEHGTAIRAPFPNRRTLPPAKLTVISGFQSVPNGHSNQAPNTSIGTRKYPWIQPRFYSPFWRNKPRHALSLQTGSVGAKKAIFAFSPPPSVRRESMKKNVKSSIFRKKTSKFLSSLPFKS